MNTVHGAENKAHFAGIDKANSEYEHLPLQVAQKKLVDVLGTFSGLVNLCTVPLDYTEYLGGWPTPEQHGFITPWHDFLYEVGTPHHPSDATHLPATSCYRLYSFHSAEIIAAILRAIHTAKIVILDLRFSERLRTIQYTWTLPTSFSSLRTLRIEVQVCDIFDFVATEPKSAFLGALKE